MGPDTHFEVRRRSEPSNHYWGVCWRRISDGKQRSSHEPAVTDLLQHQVTAFGGQKPVPFQRAIPQSPALVPLPGIQQQEDTFQQFLSLLNISTLEEARMLPSDKLITANSKQISNAPYATFIYGPAVDGLFSPEIPSKLLLQGSCKRPQDRAQRS